MTGAMFNVGRVSDPPAPSGTYVVDAITAYSAVEAVLAALLHRARTGQGQLVSVNMLDAAIAVQAQELSIFTVGRVPQRRSQESHGHVYIRAPYGAFETSDGYVAIAMPNLKALGDLLGSPDLGGMDEHVDGYEQRDAIISIVSRGLRQRTTAEWLDLFEANGIWASPVNGYADLLKDPQVQHNGSFVTYDHPTEGTVTTPGFPWKFSETPAVVSRPAPLAGEHSEQVLEELGYDRDQISLLASQGVVHQHRRDPSSRL
jgi:crotonobetainyl-CoA:carnitine CoA-transferase CaiB-like acyl-CoA transferase